jgi:hypothetical protein
MDMILFDIITWKQALIFIVRIQTSTGEILILFKHFWVVSREDRATLGTGQKTIFKQYFINKEVVQV